MSPNYDAEMISAMRRALDEVFADRRFMNQSSVKYSEAFDLQ